MRSSIRALGFSVYLPSSLMAVAQMALLVVLPLYVLDLGQSLSVAALVFAMRGLGSVVVNVPASLLIERHGYKAGMLLGNGLMAAGALVIAQSASAAVLALATLAFGAGAGTWLLARLACITEQAPTHQRGKAMAGLAALQRVGLLLGPLLGGVGAEQLGFRAVFLAIAAAAVVTMSLVWMVAPPASPEGRAAGGEAGAESGGSAAAMLLLVPRMLGRHRRIFLGAGVFAFCLQLVREQRRLLVVLWGTRIGIDPEAIGLIVSVAATVDLAMAPVAGFVMDRWGRKAAGVGSIVTLGTAMGLLPLTGSAATFVCAALLAGIGNGLGSGLLLTLGADLAPAGERSRFLGVWRLVGDCGVLAGPLLTSGLASLPAALALTWLIGAAGGGVLWRRVPETLKPAGAAAEGRASEPQGP